MEQNNNYCREDAEKYYDLLHHESETELRLYNNKHNSPARNFFVHSKDEFLSTIEDNLDKGMNISAGLNEREHLKGGDDDVKRLGCIMCDFDAHNEKQSIEEVEKQALDLVLRFSNNNIAASMAFSGRGYHVLIPFKAVVITKDNREEWKQKLKILRQHLVDKFGVDSATFNLSRVSRVVGTFNLSAKKISRWLDYRGYSDNFEFIDLINTLYKENPISIKMNDSETISTEVEAKRHCGFFDIVALNEKFPEGDRHSILIKNLAVYTNYTGNKELRESFCKFQGMELKEFGGWDDSFNAGTLKKFNCGEIYNYCKKRGIKDPCFKCPYNNFRYSEKKVGFTKKADKAKIVIMKNLFQANKTLIGEHDVITNVPVYNLFETRILVGNPFRYLLCLDESEVREGDQLKFVTPLKSNHELYDLFLEHPPEEKIQIKMAVNFGMDKKKAEKMAPDGTLFDWLVTEDMKNINSYLRCLGSGVDEDDVKSLSNEDTKKLIEDYVTLGLNVDNRVKLAMESDFLLPDISTADFNTYQFYNNHKVIYTGTKAGKTTISMRMGHNAARTSIQNLMGFATGDEINRGTLHRYVRPVYIDELEEEQPKSLYGKLLSFLEMATVNIDVGKKSITCEGLSSITFLGNPKEIKEFSEKAESMSEIVRQFDSTLKSITSNFAAIGSRIGLIVFDPDTNRISGKQKFNEDELEILFAKTDYIRKIAAPVFTKMLRDPQIRAFLDSPFDKVYADTISAFSEKASVESVRKFMSGSLNSYKHTNGTAFRLACLDYMNDIINNNYDAVRIVERSKHYLDICKSINLRSFEKVVDNPDVNKFLSAGLKASFDNENLEMKAVVSSIYNYIREKGKKSTIYVGELHDYIANSNYKPENRGVASIVDRLDKHKLEQDYRIEFASIDGVEYFVIKDYYKLILLFGDFAKANIFATTLGAFNG